MMTQQSAQLVSCEWICIKMHINHKSAFQMPYKIMQWYCFSIYTIYLLF